MINKDNVVKGLEYCAYCECENCDYDTRQFGVMCMKTLIKDALTVIKEQEEYIRELSHAPAVVHPMLDKR